MHTKCTDPTNWPDWPDWLDTKQLVTAFQRRPAKAEKGLKRLHTAGVAGSSPVSPASKTWPAAFLGRWPGRLSNSDGETAERFVSVEVSGAGAQCVDGFQAGGAHRRIQPRN